MATVVEIHLPELDEQILEHASVVIRAGGIIVYPTETLYGIGADALNATAVRKVIANKKERGKKPIGVIAGNLQQVSMVAASVNSFARMLIDNLWPGPLTLIFDATPIVPPEITGDTGTIGVRIPSNNFCLALLRRTGCVLTATSANVSGTMPEKSIQKIQASLDGPIDLFIDAGILKEGKPSTVLDVRGTDPVLIREGAIPFQQIQSLLRTA